MAATIQNIELPKLARARDTSSSLQPIGPNLLAGSDFTSITQAESTSGAVWVTGVGWTIGSGVASCDGSQSGVSYLSNQDTDLDNPTTKFWEITYSITARSAGTVQAMVGGYGPTTTAQSAVGTYTEIVGPINPSSVNKFYIGASADFVGSVDNVIVKEAINFNNNNHGQIYSGRALEFDGVSDYLTIPLSTSVAPTTNITVACWVHRNVSGNWATIWGKLNGFTSGVWVAIDSAGELRCQLEGVVAHASFAAGSNKMEDGVWYRIVMTYDSLSGGVLYINGESVGTTTATGAITQPATNNYQIGTNNSDYIFDGMMSDFQLWDSTWTTADVTYDYLNPEQTAISGGGTALTESNLKLWYPMQDGHRGQQSYILDGANTGAVVELITDGDFPSETTAWSFGGGWSLGDGVASGAAGSGSKLTQTNTLNGKFCKVTFTVSNYVGTSLVLVDFGSVSSSYITSNGTHTVYGTYDQNNFEIYKASGFSGDITNISVKQINDKHHAATVFHGDELVENGDFAINEAENQLTLDGGIQFDDWSEAPSTGTRTFTSITNGFRSTVGTAQTANYQQRVSQSVASDLVIGRTYSFSCGFLTSDGLSMRVAIQTAGSANVQIGGTNSTSAGVQQTLSGTFVCDDNTSQIIDIWPTAVQATGAYFEITNVTLKEVGLASGWTDADQQLHIPQTALQSYNELAWFDGEEDYVDINPSTAIWNGSDGEWNSVSCWVNHKGHGESTMYWKLDAYPAFYANVAGSNYKIGYNTLNGEVFGITIANTLVENKWNHWVMNWKRNSNSNDTAIGTSDVELFLNGVKQSLAYESGSNSNGAATTTTSDINLMSMGGSSLPTAGAMTEVSTWKDQLSDAEVLELFNDGKALDALTHSNSNLSAYWRNDGLSTWSNLVNPGTNDGTPTSVTETILIPQGIDSSRDSQGFIMNKQKDTSCFNNTASGGYIEIPVGAEDDDLAFLGVGDGFSVQVWIKVNGDSNGALILSRNNNTDGYRLEYNTSEKISFGIEENGTIKTAATDSAISAGTWYHIVGTFDGDPDNDGSGEIKLYLNGETGGSVTTNSTTSNDMDTSISPMRIGKHYWAGAKLFDGAIDGVLIYNKVLSLEEVERNYKATKGSHRN